MTRRSLFALSAAPALRATAQQQSPVAVQWHKIETVNPVDLPAASGAWTKSGVLVEVATDTPHCEAYDVTLRYWMPSQCRYAEQRKTVPRLREDQERWTQVAFWTGEPVEVHSIRARELVAGAEEVVGRAA